MEVWQLVVRLHGMGWSASVVGTRDAAGERVFKVFFNGRRVGTSRGERWALSVEGCRDVFREWVAMEGKRRGDGHWLETMGRAL